MFEQEKRGCSPHHARGLPFPYQQVEDIVRQNFGVVLGLAMDVVMVLFCEKIREQVFDLAESEFLTKVGVVAIKNGMGDGSSDGRAESRLVSLGCCCGKIAFTVELGSGRSTFENGQSVNEAKSLGKLA